MRRTMDPDYYATRLSAEREAAAAATCEEARESHLELAEHYRQLLAACMPLREVGGSADATENSPARA